MTSRGIPRPAAVEPGAPAPWEAWVREVAASGAAPLLSTADVKAALVDARELQPVEDEEPAFAVLVPLWDEQGEARVLLTRRTTWLRSHSGQVSFPGGRVEPGEAYADAALREAWEEVGIDPRTVSIAGRLSHVRTISNPAAIHPFVGVLAARPVLAVNGDEVERAFDVGLSELLADGAFHEEVWGIGGLQRPMYFFEVSGETVWGATARMLYELLTMITSRRARRALGR